MKRKEKKGEREGRKERGKKKEKQQKHSTREGNDFHYVLCSAVLT